MAYHIGRVLHQFFGYEVFIVGRRDEKIMFSYPFDFPAIPQDVFEKTVTSDDLLVCNPSFSNQQFGLRLPCKKLSYIQGIRSFSILDVYFNHYVFVSFWVKSFIEKYYGIRGNIIPAFIDTDLFSCSDSWSQRDGSITLTAQKYDEAAFSRLRSIFSMKYPDCPLKFQLYPVMKQYEFAQALRKHRYYLSTTVMEGFGLPMLEAMASGCTSVGWDAGGSSEYAVHGQNSMLSTYGDMDSLADNLHFVLTNPGEAYRLSKAGVVTGRNFSKERFDKAWVAELSQFLALTPLRQP